MALDYLQLKALKLPVVRDSYGRDRCILYALSVGAGLGDKAPLNDELALLYEEQLQTLPAMACVVGYAGFWMRDARYGLDWRRVVHGEQRLQIKKALPVEATLYGSTRVLSISDRGEGRGAVVVMAREIRDEAGDLVACVEQTNFCRGDGGYSAGNSQRSDPLPEPVERAPQRSCDLEIRLPTARNQAAIYRLNGDRNPLHVDARAARDAGFSAPILHGAATVGMVNRALRCVQPESSREVLSDFRVRFSGVFYPGDTMRVQLWADGDQAAFRCISENSGSEIAYGKAQWERQ